MSVIKLFIVPMFLVSKMFPLLDIEPTLRLFLNVEARHYQISTFQDRNAGVPVN